MSQRHVEAVIGKLATDEQFRRRFLADGAGAIDDLRMGGCELTRVEAQALMALDPEAVSAFARAIDHRLQKVDLAAELLRD